MSSGPASASLVPAAADGGGPRPAPASREASQRDWPLAIVMNEGSGHQDTQARIDTVRGALRDDGREHLLLPVTAGGELPRALDRARAWAEAHDGALVAAGGDGTLNAVAQVAHGLGCPMGVLPHGTFNYFARSHGLPLDLDEGMRALLRAEPRPVQVGQVNGRVFLVNASLGLYPQIVSDREAFKARFGRYRFNAGLSALLTVLRGYRAWRLRLELAERMVDVETTTLFVGNNRLQLQQLGLPESGLVGEGALAAVMVRPVGRWRLVGLALQGAMGRLAQASAAVDFAFRRLTVQPRRRGRRTLRVALDGEVSEMPLPLTFEVAPVPLRLLLPPAAPGEGTGEAP